MIGYNKGKSKIKNGVYIFEGIDNVGKTSIIQLLKQKIESEDEQECEVLSFPGKTANTLGALVYDIHHNQTQFFSKKINNVSLQMLHVASHIDLLIEKLNKVSKEKVVLLDRFWWSTLAYGCIENDQYECIKKIIAIELPYWKEVKINKIFLVERDNRICDYNDEIIQQILAIYTKLMQDDPRASVIRNNCELEKTVQMIYRYMCEGE